MGRTTAISEGPQVGPVYVLVDPDFPAGDTVEIPAGLYQFALAVPDNECVADLFQWQGAWHQLAGIRPDPLNPGPKSMSPAPFRLPACGVRVEAAVSRYPRGIGATLTRIGD